MLYTENQLHRYCGSGLNMYGFGFCCAAVLTAFCCLEQQQHIVCGGWVVVGGLETHNLVKPTFTWLWLSWVLTIMAMMGFMWIVDFPMP